MIRLVLLTARETIEEDGQHWDTWYTVEERVTLRDKVYDWQSGPYADQYPPIQVWRDLVNHIEPMIAYMDFETEEEAALFKLRFPEL